LPNTASSDSNAALTYTGGQAVAAYYGIPSPAPSALIAAANLAGANGICQTFVVPVNAVLTLNVNEGGYEQAGDGDDQEATLFIGGISALSGSPSPIPVFSELNAYYKTSPAPNPSTSPNLSTYQPRGPYTLSTINAALTPGTTVTLFLGTYDNEPSYTYGEFMLVDDVSVFGNPVQATATTRRVPAQSTLMNQRTRTH
jgi:hypothetical protein